MIESTPQIPSPSAHTTSTPPARREALRRPVQPAWRTVAAIWAGQEEGSISPVHLERLRPLDRHADRNTDAEYSLYRLSGRFLKYAEEYLFPHERILAFVPWSDRATDSWRARLSRALTPGGRQPREGLLLATTRQILLLRDDEEPVAGMYFSGYSVDVTTYERLAHVSWLKKVAGKGVQLAIAVRASEAQETITWIFPGEAITDIETLVTLIERFLPRSDERRPRLPGFFAPRNHLQTLVSRTPNQRSRPRVTDVVDPALGAALQERLLDSLRRYPGPDGAPRRVRALAMIPDTGEGPRLIAVTQEHLFVVSLPDKGEVLVYPLTQVTSIELRRSVLETHVAWRLGAKPGGLVQFPPVTAAQSLDVFATLRQALTLLPVEAAGPDLPDQDDQDEPGIRSN